MKANVDLFTQHKFVKNIWKTTAVTMEHAASDILKGVNGQIVDLGAEDQIASTSISLVISDDGEYNCAGCKDSWTEIACVKKHVINNKKIFFCLNCDDWIQYKLKVFDQGWTLLDAEGYLRTGR